MSGTSIAMGTGSTHPAGEEVTSEMSDPRQDLQATMESIRRDAELVRSLEEQKAALDPADPQVEGLSRRIEQLTSDMANKGEAERELAEEVQDR